VLDLIHAGPLSSILHHLLLAFKSSRQVVGHVNLLCQSASFSHTFFEAGAIDVEALVLSHGGSFSEIAELNKAVLSSVEHSSIPVHDSALKSSFLNKLDGTVLGAKITSENSVLNDPSIAVDGLNNVFEEQSVLFLSLLNRHVINNFELFHFFEVVNGLHQDRDVLIKSSFWASLVLLLAYLHPL